MQSILIKWFPLLRSHRLNSDCLSAHGFILPKLISKLLLSSKNRLYRVNSYFLTQCATDTSIYICKLFLFSLWFVLAYDVSTPNNIPLMMGLKMNNILKKGLQGRGHSLIKTLPWYLSGRSKEYYKVSQSWHPLSQPWIELDTSKILDYSIITTPAPMLPPNFINLLLVVIMNKVYDFYYILLGSWMAVTTENSEALGDSPCNIPTHH